MKYFKRKDAYSLALMTGKELCFVIGGATVYEKALSDADELYITRVHTTVPDANAWFLGINSDIWSQIRQSEVQTSADGTEFEFVVYERTVRQ